MDWQTWIALTVVAFAAWRIAIQSRAFFSSNEQTACGSCKACPSSSSKLSSGEFVSLETGFDKNEMTDGNLQ